MKLPLGPLVAILLAFASIPALAQDKALGTAPNPIDFDAALSVGCRMVTPKDFSDANADFKIVEASVKISANFLTDEKLVESIAYRITIPPKVEVADYLPKTHLDTDIAGPIATEKRGTQRTSMMVSVDGGGKVAYRLPVAEAEAHLQAGFKGEKGGEVTSGVQMNQLPPKQLVIAAGTEQRGQKLYFKLRPFSQITLEGMKEFALLLVVPKDWTGDCIQLECTAWRAGTTQPMCRKTMTVGLYTDSASKRRVELQARDTPETIHLDPNSTASASTTSPGPKPATPAAPMPTEMPAAETLTLKGCAGAYKNETSLYSYVYELGSDGKWEGKQSLTIAGLALSATDTLGIYKLRSISHRGTWSIKENTLMVISEEEWGTLFGWYKITPKILINEEVSSFDKNLKAFVLKSGTRLGPK